MDLQVLISTMNPDPNSFKDLGFSTLVISQNSKGEIVNSDQFQFLSFNEKGLSKSRNRAIDSSTAKYGVIADDDVRFCEDFEKKIKNGFIQYPDADILTFKILTPDAQPYKNYGSTSFKHSRSTIYKVSSVEIVVRLDKIKKAGLRFDERFGLGAEFKSSEEMIFLNDALDAGLKLYYIPEFLVIHPKESSGKILDGNFFKSKGALVKRLYKKSIYFVLGLVFLIKQLVKSNKTIPVTSAIKEIVKGYNSIL